MRYSNDPVSDYEAYMTEQEKELNKLPKCDYCNEPIQEEFYFDINGEVMCENCLDRFFRKDVADYVN